LSLIFDFLCLFCKSVICSGKFDNGGRFDLRLPYADQGYVDEDADVMGKIGSFFGGGKKKKVEPPAPAKKEEPKKKKNSWPW
jgi:hypothetical protein